MILFLISYAENLQDTFVIAGDIQHTQLQGRWMQKGK
jgi:hypothetical protein